MSLGWLHLTDLHQGLAGQSSRWPNVRQRFFEDLERLHEKAGPWDLVFFTGDLTQSGKREEFAVLEETLGELWVHLGSLGSKPALLAVPGNHDLVRPRGKPPAVRVLEQWHTEREIREEFWENVVPDYREIVNEAFAPFAEFWRRTRLRTIPVQDGLLPGDFSASIVGQDGMRLGVVGLNSSFLQLAGGNYQERLALDVRQLHAACGGDAVRWWQDHDAAILLTHHPIAWLSRDARAHFRSEIAPPGRFAAHLFGHMHEPGCESVAQGGSRPYHAIQGASLFGLETWGDEQKGRIHGYGAGRVALQGDTIQIRYWSRRNVQKQAGHFCIEADTTAEIDADGAILISMPKPKAAQRRLDAHPSPPFAALLRSYRARIPPLFEGWDWSSSVIFHAAGPSRTSAVRFDDVYQPLSVVREGEQAQPSGPAAHDPLDLLERRPLLVVRGAGGTGKSTWLRWAFLRLIASDQVLPLFIPLRALARRWQDPTCQGERRSLDAFLDDWGAEHVDGWKDQWRGVFRSSGAPTPVLLLDGWDEVGALGDELCRKLLGFIKDYPRVNVAITSRHDGWALPTELDGFGSFAIQPLSREEVMLFAEKLIVAFRASDKASNATELSRFAQALDRSPDLVKLSATPLLLSLMVQVHLAHSLPSKRHHLYRVYIEHLLVDRPDRKVTEGALAPERSSRPEDGDERRRLVAALAASLQEAAGKRSAVSRTRAEMAALLPEDWPASVGAGSTREQMRRGFINWLIGVAGLLVEEEGAVGFAHIGFQDYLSAWHLEKVTSGDDERVRVFAEKADDVRWWEVLRQWAALVQSDRPERARKILEPLLDSKASHTRALLAGTLLADEIGDDALFGRWLERLPDLIEGNRSKQGGLCAAAWAASRQESWRNLMVARLTQAAKALGIFRRTLIERWTERCGLAGSLALPAEGSVARDVIAALRSNHFETNRGVVAARILAAIDPFFMGFYAAPDVALLGLLWPSQRARVSFFLQLAAAFGATRADIRRKAARLLRRPKPDEDGAIARPMMDGSLKAAILLRLQKHDAHMDPERELAAVALIDKLARFYDTDLVYYLDGPAAERGTSKNSGWIEGAFAAAGWLADVAADGYERWSGQAQSNLAAEFALAGVDRILGAVTGLDPATPWLREFTLALIASIFEGGMKECLATMAERSGPFSILVPAYWIYLSGLPDEDTRAELEDAIAQHAPMGDPLWTALARHVARVSTEADRALLSELAMHPERREGTLGWSLRYVARGDVPVNDGGDILLDDIADDLGLERLPYLEDMPPHIEVTEQDLETARRQIRVDEWFQKLEGQRKPK